jgi:hypothetical protein
LPTLTHTTATESIVDVASTTIVQATPITGPFSLEIEGSGTQFDGSHLNAPGNNVQTGSETYAGAKEQFTLDQFGYLHLGTSDVLACQQTLGGFQDFRFLPTADCLAEYFQPVTCSFNNAVLSCSGFYGSLFTISQTSGEIFLGTSSGFYDGVSFTPYRDTSP